MRGPAILLFLTLPLGADFKSGLEAYERGDFQAALHEWLPAAEKGDPNAQYDVGLAYTKLNDNAKALEWYRKAADHGLPAAQYSLGVIYGDGLGVPANPREAIQWFQKACDQGLHIVDEYLGHMYASDAVKDYGAAMKWYRKAAERGSPTAQFKLAEMYDLGRGIPRNFEEALRWYRKAADRGNGAACANIGVLYYNQQGVKRDLVQAYAWFARAWQAGDPRAGELLQATVKRMKPADINKALEIAKQWQPSKPTGEADRMEATNLFRAPRPTAASNTAVERMVVVANVEGEQLLNALAIANLVDGDGNWIGGKTTLVEIGDLRDKAFLAELGKQAAAAGGSVRVVGGEAVQVNDTLFIDRLKDEKLVDAVLPEQKAARVVAGHDDPQGVIVPRRGGKLVLIDSRLSLACLVIENGNAYAQYRGKALALPADDGPDMQRYLRQVATIKP